MFNPVSVSLHQARYVAIIAFTCRWMDEYYQKEKYYTYPPLFLLSVFQCAVTHESLSRVVTPEKIYAVGVDILE